MAKVTRVGGSIGITIPKEEAAALGIKLGDEVIVRRVGSHLEVIPAELRPKLRPAIQKAFDRTVEKFDATLDELAR